MPQYNNSTSSMVIVASKPAKNVREFHTNHSDNRNGVPNKNSKTSDSTTATIQSVATAILTRDLKK